jgi:hypothetical protein
MTSTLRKNEAKLERAEEKFKKLVERTQSMSLSRQPSEETQKEEEDTDEL